VINPSPGVTKTPQTNDISELPIGVFDSGLGGLTVVKQLFKRLPHESIIYFGDTARVPYGSKSVETVQRFSLQIARFLEKQGIKLLVVACNTASSVAIDFLRERISIPVIGVIEPGARAALKVSSGKEIGVIGTTATIAAGRYEMYLRQMDPAVRIDKAACPLLVPLVEEGWIDTEVTELVVRQYLAPLLERKIDTLILGCTHYPLIKTVIARVVGDQTRIVDTSVETAAVVNDLLQARGLAARSEQPAQHRFFVSDFPQKFEEIAHRFLGEALPNVERANLDDLNP